MAIVRETSGQKGPGYRGRQAKTGNSLGLRFDKALFQSHPEFSGEVRAHVIAPGRMLVVAEPISRTRRRDADPVMEAFLSFLATDMTSVPRQITPFGRPLADRIDAVVGGIATDPNEDPGDEPLL